MPAGRKVSPVDLAGPENLADPAELGDPAESADDGGGVQEEEEAAPGRAENRTPGNSGDV